MLKFYFEDEVEFKDINTMTYHKFIQHEMVLYADAGYSKKQLNNFRKKIEKRSFYPIHIIRKYSNDTEELMQNKLKQSQKKNEDKFKMRYRQVAKKQFGVESLLEIRDKIAKCPFCHKKLFTILHDYTVDNTTDCSLSLICDFCNQILDRKVIFGMIDSHYIYNAKIQKYMDAYCYNYCDKTLKSKILHELKNTEIISIL